MNPTQTIFLETRSNLLFNGGNKQQQSNINNGNGIAIYCIADYLVFTPWHTIPLFTLQSNCFISRLTITENIISIHGASQRLSFRRQTMLVPQVKAFMWR